MARLPVPGGDNDTWGNVLNDFLSQAHTAAGDIKDGVVTENVIADGSVSAGKLSAASPTNGQVLGYSGSGLVWTTPSGSGSVPDATAGTKGLVQLAGDLSGTAAAPTVPGLSTKEPTITAGNSTQYWRGDKSWQTLNKAAVGLGNVDNTSDASKPISTATQTALNAKAPLASPTFTGTVTVPTPTNTTDAATKAYVDSHTGTSVAVQDEGTTLTSAATNLNFVGSGVTATNTGSNVTVTVSAGGGSLGSATPQALGTATAGTSSSAAHEDHVHPTTGLALATGGGLETISTNTTATGAVTLNLANGNVFSLTLTGNVTFTFSGATSGKACSFGLYLKQDATGNRTVTWPGSAKWPGGVAPILSSTTNATDILIFESIDGGTTWYGSLVGANFL